MTRPLRPATKLAGLFAGVGTVIFVIGVAGGFEAAPLLWREAWVLAAVVDFALAIAVGYYIFQSGGPRV